MITKSLFFSILLITSSSTWAKKNATDKVLKNTFKQFKFAQKVIEQNGSHHPYDIATGLDMFTLVQDERTEARIIEIIGNQAANEIQKFEQIKKAEVNQTLQKALGAGDQEILSDDVEAQMNKAANKAALAIEEVAEDLKMYKVVATDSNNYQINYFIAMNPISGKLLTLSIQATE